jgi:phage FluMu protein Com
VLQIHCDNQADGKECGRFLGKLDGATVYLYCPRCKTFHALAVVDIVKHLAAEVVAHGDNGNGPLLW